MPSLRQLDHPPSPRLVSSVQWPPCRSPIHLPLLSYYLGSHPDQDFARFILQGLGEGFHIGYSSSSILSRHSVRNHPSSSANRIVISDYISQEVATGRMVGPLVSPLQQSVHCSPIGLVPKGRNTGKWRMIVDLSHPSGRSVNDGIAPAFCSPSYPSVADAVQFIRMLGPGTLLLKVDLRSAYRIVPVHPLDRHLLGICWEDQVYIDQALPFGLRSAPILFTAVADALAWALMRAGITIQMHYLDDFLFFFPPSSGSGIALLSQVMGVFNTLGVPVAEDKIEGPATVVTFLGIQIDTSRFELRLTEEKVQFVNGLVRSWIRRRSGRSREFDSLLGHLSHAATVIRQGRVFLRHLYNIQAESRSPYHYVHVDVEARADLLWWDHFLQHWNGAMFFRQSPVPTEHVFTDASGSIGAGGFWKPRYCFQLQWPNSWSDVDIVVKELVPVVIAAALWGRHWYRAHVCFHIDNEAVVGIIQRQSGRSSVIQHLLRCFYFYSALFQFTYTAVHISGESNTAADALSRDRFTLFLSLYPQAARVHIPQPVMEMLITRQPDWGSPDWTGLFVSTLTLH